MRKFIGLISIILGVLFFVPLGDGDTINAIKFVGSVIGFFIGFYALFLKQFLTGLIGIILNLISVAMLIFVAGFLTFIVGFLNSDAVQTQIQAAPPAAQPVVQSAVQTSTQVASSASTQPLTKQEYYPPGYSRSWIKGKFETSNKFPYGGRSYYQIPNTEAYIQTDLELYKSDPSRTIKSVFEERSDNLSVKFPNAVLKFIKSLPSDASDAHEHTHIYMIENIHSNTDIQALAVVDHGNPGPKNYMIYSLYSSDLETLKQNWPSVLKIAK